MAEAFPDGTSTWQFIGGRWFPANRTSVTPSFSYSIATSYTNGGQRIDAGTVGLSEEELNILRTRYRGAVKDVPPGSETIPGVREFTLPLVPEGTVIDITPRD
jgi:hypothetical protein